jgi:hypothetical protein
METVVEIEPTLTALREAMRLFSPEVAVEPIGVDPRNGWDTHIVLVDGKPWGYTDGPLPKDGSTCPNCGSSRTGEFRSVLLGNSLKRECLDCETWWKL